MGSWFVKGIKNVVNEYDKKYKFDNTLVQKDLGIEFIDEKTCLIENAYSLIEKGWLPNKLPK